MCKVNSFVVNVNRVRSIKKYFRYIEIFFACDIEIESLAASCLVLLK